MRAPAPPRRRARSMRSRPWPWLARAYPRSGVRGRALRAFVGVGVARQALVDDPLGRRSAVRGLPLGEVAVDHAGALAALVDGPHDQRLAAASVACGEDAVDRRRIGPHRLDVTARVLLDPELPEQLLLGQLGVEKDA